jgi:hypothetical protein
MARLLTPDEGVALLKHYEVDVAEGHLREGTSIVLTGGSTPDAERVITATIGDHHAQRLCPVTDFLAAGLIDELGDSHLKAKPQLSRAIAHLVVKLSRMQVESVLVAFSLQATIEGDHYEVVPKSVVIEASAGTTIPHRLSPHAHDRGNLHSARPPRR